MTKGRGDVIRLAVGVGMILLYFCAIQPRLGMFLLSPFIIWFYFGVVGILVAPPIAGFLAEKFVFSPFRPGAGRASKECSKARSLAAQGMFGEAIEEYRRGLEKEPKNITLRLEIAEIYGREMEDFGAAISELEACLKSKLKPTEGASVLNRMADIYESNLNDPRSALAALRRIGEEWPGTNVAEKAVERMETIEKRLPGKGE